MDEGIEKQMAATNRKGNKSYIKIKFSMFAKFTTSNTNTTKNVHISSSRSKTTILSLPS